MAKTSKQDFKAAYCKIYHCNPDDYERDMFLRCFSSSGKYWARIILFINPKFFTLDLELIERVGRATEFYQVKQAISNYFLHSGFKRSLFRDKLHIRISSSKLEDIAYKLLELDELQAKTPHDSPIY